MIQAQEAVKLARESFDAVFASDAVAEVLLEEVELSDDGKFWLVTYSFDWQPTSGTSSIGPGDRRYKLLRLDIESGKLISMKTTQNYQ